MAAEMAGKTVACWADSKAGHLAAWMVVRLASLSVAPMAADLVAWTAGLTAANLVAHSAVRKVENLVDQWVDNWVE